MGRILINNIHLNYEAYGKGKPVLFLHGAYLSIEEWKYQKDYFAKNNKVILLDMPGHGNSDNFPHYSSQAIAGYIIKFIEAVNIKPCIICGHSFGGMIAQEIALASADSVDKLILADTSYGVKTTVVESFLTWISMLVINFLKVDKQAKLYAKQMGKLHKEVYYYVYREIKKYETNYSNYKNIWNAVINFNSKDKLRKISCPTLILAGDLNKQTHKQAKFMKEMIPYSKLAFIKNAKHMCTMDNFDDFNKEIEQFVNS